jgi:hypothetical protein
MNRFRRFLKCIIFIFCLTNSVSASNITFFHGAREAGLANSSVALPGVWSVYSNPGGMVFNKAPTMALSYQNRYQLKELSTTSVAGIMPGRFGALGASLSYFGTNSYNEQKYAVGYAHKLGEKISAGVMFDYFITNLPSEYETSHALAGEVGILVNPVERLNLGFHVFNISGSDYKLYHEESLPILYRAGAAWNDELFLISSQIQLENNGNVQLSLGSEIMLVKNLFFRAGISSNTLVNYSFGLGYKLNSFVCDVAFTHHPVLGFSSSVSLQYCFSGKER